MSFVPQVSHALCERRLPCRAGQLDPRTGALLVHSARFVSAAALRAQLTPAPQPIAVRAALARAPPAPSARPQAANEAFRIVLSLPAGMAAPARLLLNESEPRIARALADHARLTFVELRASLADGFTATEAGSVVIEFGPATRVTRTRAEMLQDEGALFGAGRSAELVERFTRPVNGFSRVVVDAQRTNGAPGAVLWYHNSAAVAKDLIIEVRARATMAIRAAAFVAPAAGAIGAVGALRDVGNGLVEITVPAAGQTRRASGNLHILTGSTWADTGVALADAPGLSSLFPATPLTWAAGLRIVAGRH